MFQPISHPGKVVPVPTLLEPRAGTLARSHFEHLGQEKRPDWDKVLLVKPHQVEILHLMIPQGITIPTYEAPGEIILHCLKGEVLVRADLHPHLLKAGELLYLLLEEPFSLQSLEDTSLLVTIVAFKTGRNVPLIGE